MEVYYPAISGLLATRETSATSSVDMRIDMWSTSTPVCTYCKRNLINEDQDFGARWGERERTLPKQDQLWMYVPHHGDWDGALAMMSSSG